MALGGGICIASMLLHTAQMHQAIAPAGWGHNCCLLQACWVRLLWPQQVCHVVTLLQAEDAFWSGLSEHNRWLVWESMLCHAEHLSKWVCTTRACRQACYLLLRCTSILSSTWVSSYAEHICQRGKSVMVWNGFSVIARWGMKQPVMKVNYMFFLELP